MHGSTWDPYELAETSKPDGNQETNWKPEDIEKIEGIDLDTAKELINRSKENLIKEREEVSKKLKELGVEESLINLKGMTQGMLVILGQKNIKKLKDFADLSSCLILSSMFLGSSSYSCHRNFRNHFGFPSMLRNV